MIYQNKFRLVIKAIAAVIVCVFTWQQISWAGAGELIANDKLEVPASGVSANQLASQQAVNSSAVDLQNAIEGFSAPAAEPIAQAQSVSLPRTERSSSVLSATYYANGRMESQTLTTPDAQGMIYYHYLDENWNNQGYGRVDKSRRQAAVNGELTYTYSYYADSTGRLQTKRGCSDANFTTEATTYTYYNDATNRMKSKQLTSADNKGMNYYEYLNEDFNGQGFGRIEKSQKPYYKAWFSTPEYSYLYGYQDDVSERYAYIYVYSDMTWTTFARKYFYYDDETNYLEKETEITNNVGSTEYHYMNENWNNSGHGRKDWLDSSGMWGSYYNEYYYYDDEFGRLSHLRSYDIGYFSGHVLDYDEYYRNDATNSAEYRLYAKPDSSGNVYYYYRNRSGYAEDRSYRRDSSNGELSHSYAYVKGDPYKGIEVLYGYSDNAWTDLVSTTTYYPGYQGYIKTKTLVSADANGFIKYDYLNENFDNQGFGRVGKCSRATPRDGVLVITKEYFGTSSRVKIERGYADEALTKLVMTKEFDESGNIINIVYTDSATILYYPSGRVESRRLNTPDAQGVIYYHYMDEDWQASGCGRIDSAYRKSALDGELSFTYTYYSDPAGLLQTKKSYSDVNFTSSMNTYTYFNDTTNLLQEKICPETTTTYYNDATNRMKSKQLTSADSKGMEYYEYLNEDFNGQGFGRVERCRKPPANYTRWVGVLEASSYLYHYLDDTTERLQDVYAYNDMNWDMIRSISRYYDDENNYLEEFYSNIWNSGYLSYHYLNENWNGTGQGRMRACDYGGVVGSGGEAWYYYNDAAGRLSRKEYYTTTYYQGPYGTLNRVECYYNDSSNRLESKTLTKADEQGNTYYHYMNEDWDNQSYGRVDKAVKQTAVNGEFAFTYTYYADSTGRLQTRKSYSDDTLAALVAIYTYANDAAGNLIQQVMADGSMYEYLEGSSTLLLREISTDSSYIEYYYTPDGVLNFYREYKTNGDILRDGVVEYVYDYESAIKSLETLSDMSITTASGDIIEYKDGAIVFITCKDGSAKIFNIELDDSGSIKNALVLYADGALGVMRNGELLQLADRNGAFIRYRDGRKATEYSEVTGIASYTYTLAEDNATINETRVWSRDAVCLYDAQGRPISFAKTDGELIEYENGHIRKISTASGMVYLYTFVENEEKAILESSCSTSDYPSAIYYANGQISKIEYSNGGAVIKTLEYTTDSDGNPVIKVRNAAGELEDPGAEIVSTYAFTPTGIGDRQIVVERDGINRIYDQSGNLQALEKDGVEIGFDNSGSVINFSLEDGSMLTAPKFENNQIMDGTISKKDAQGNLLYTVVYEAGKMRSYTDAQGNECVYDADGNLTKLKKRMSDGVFVTYVYTKSLITVAEVPEDGRSLLADDDLVVIKYEDYDSGKRIIYSETKAGAFKNYSYTESGIEVEEGVFKINGSQRVPVSIIIKFYDKDMRLISVVGSNGIHTLYEYNEYESCALITVVKKGVSYVFEKGKLKTVISENGGKSFYYENGFIESREISAGNFEKYNYGGDSVLNLGSSFLEQGIVYNLTYLPASEDNAVLCLDRQEIDYGDGRDGDLVVQTGQSVVIDGPKQYSSVYIAQGAVVTVSSWNGETGGVIDIRCNGTVKIDGALQADAKGYRGGSDGLGDLPGCLNFMQGESYQGVPTYSSTNNYGGGGGFYGYPLCPYLGYACAAGGSYGSAGTTGKFEAPSAPSVTGSVYGDKELTISYMGSGGGGGTGFTPWMRASGGNGGGVVKIIGPSISINGVVSCNGGDGAYASGGGSGGSILIQGESVNISGSVFSKGGGNGGGCGGVGGDGRIRINYGNLDITGVVGPEAYYKQFEYAREGSLTFAVMEVDPVVLKNISWIETLPDGANVLFQVRVGNTPTPDNSWSDWSEDLTEPSGSNISLPAARYIQVKATLITTTPYNTPTVTLSNDGGIMLECISIQEGNVTLENMSLVQVSRGNNVYYYNSDGKNIDNQNDSINIADLSIDMTMVNSLLADAMLYYENTENFNLEPMPGSQVSSETVWSGTVDSANIDSLANDDTVLMTYKNDDKEGGSSKKLINFKKKNGDEGYCYYSDIGKTVVDEIKGSDGTTTYYVVSQYDNNGVIQQSDYIYDDVTKNTTLQYLNGQKNKLVKHAETGDIEVLTYAYETMSNGADVIVITDKSDPDNIITKYYVDDQLIKMVDKNQLETRYEYSSDGKISASVISRHGVDMERYVYTYDIATGYTIMTDSSGVKKAYDKDNKIVYIEKDNKIYSYYYAQGNTAVTNSDVETIKSYLTDLESAACTNALLRGTDLQTANLGKPDDKYEYTPGTDFAIEELTQWTDDAGNIVRYDNGNISSITKPDGVVISDVLYDGTVVSAFKVVIDGIIYTIKDGFIRGEEHPDGSSITYFSNGWISAKKDSTGVETLYIYEVPLTLKGTDSGTTYYAHIDKAEDTNDAKSLKIDDGATEGSFMSEAIEVNAEALRSIDWQGTTPDGTSVSIVIRTTNELKDDVDASNWSGWSAEIISPGSLASLSIPKGKYLQYKIVLKRNNASAAGPAIDLKTIGIDILSKLADTNDPNLIHTVTIDGKDYVYDGEERLIRIIDGATIYAYTKEGKISSITSSDGKVTTYVYDKERPTTLVETIISDQSYEYHYDSPDGRLTKTIEKSSGPSNMQWEYFYNGDVVSVKTTYVTKQSSVSDFSTFTKDNISITDYEGITRIHLTRYTPLDFGTGFDEDLVVKKGETVYLEARTYNYKSIRIEEGATVTVAPWDGTTGGKLEIKCLERAVIDGTITVDATGYPKMQGPGAGSAGQQGQDIDNSNQYERGAGGGGAGHANSGSVGQGYSYGGHTTSPGAVGGAYSDYSLTAPMMGSGGGSGGCYNAAEPNYMAPGAGGTGGGIILISAPIINVNGLLSANGGNGSEPKSGAAGCGGGGSGGSIILSGEQVSIVGNVTARGGYGGVGNQSGGNGSAGRIRVDYGVKEGEIYAGSYFVDAPSINYNQLTYVSEGTLTSNAIAIDSSVRGSETTAYLNANLDIPIRANVKIETRTGSSSDIVNGEWSEWTETTLDQFGYKINSELNGFIQYRLVLTTQENDKTPSAYAVNDFAIKLTFTSTEHKSEDTVPYMVQAGQEDKTHFTEPGKPVIGDQPLNRIENIKVGATTVPQADQAALVALSLEQTVTRQLKEEQIVGLTDTVYASALSNDEPVATKFKIESGGIMKAEYAQKRDGTIEHYDQDGNVRFVTDASGAILSRYYRDAEGNLEDVRLLTERARLDHEFDSAENEILTRRLENLQKLTEQVGAAHSNLDKQVSDIQSQIDDARAEIESMRYISYETQVQSGFGSKKMIVVMENPYYALMIAKIDLAERKFKDNAALSYFSLANMENVSKGRIQAAAMEALTNLNRQRNVCLVQILRKELTTVIYDAYVRYLGRLPSTQELNDLIESLAQKSTLDQKSYTLDMEALKTDLESRPDRIERVQEITDIVNKVLNTIEEQYINPTDRVNLINALGLSNEQIVDLANILDSTGNATGDWKAIKEYIVKNQAKTMHFGQSAFLVLKELIDDYYKKHSEAAKAGETAHERYVRLAVNAILIDILTGVMNPFTTGDLQLSIFALSKAAAVEGLDIQAYKLDWQDLVNRTADYVQTGKEKVIVHMNSNHYVIVVSIDAENKITYYEPNMGEKGETITISQAEFMKIWKGYALSERAPPEASKKLTSFQAQKIRGSDIFLIISAILSIISFVLSFIDNEFCQMLSKILAITAVVCCGIEIIGAFVNTVKSITTSMTAFKDLFTVSFAKIGDFFANTLPNFFSKVFAVPSLNFGIASISEVATNVFSAVVTMAHTITIQRGLEFLGVDPTIARIATAFVSAGMPSFGAGAFSLQNAFAGLAIEGTRQLCNVFDVPPEITNLISMTAGVIVNAGISGFTAGGFDGAITSICAEIGTTIARNVTSELLNIGIQKVGGLLGVDPRISSLVGSVVKSYVNPGVDQYDKAIDPFTGAMSALLQGAASIGMQWAGESLSLSPLLTALGVRGISGIIEGLLAPDHNPLRGLFNALTKSVYNSLTLSANVLNDSWAKVAYIAKLNDFSNIIQEKGIVSALEEYSTGIFSQDAINSMIASGTSVSAYIQKAIDEGRAMPTTTASGQDALSILLKEGGSDSILISSDNGNLLGRQMNGVYEEGTYAVDAFGKIALKDGFKTMDTSDGCYSVMQINNSLATDIEVYGDDIAYHFYGSEKDPLTIIQTDAGPKILNGVAEDMMSGIKLCYKDGRVVSDSIPLVGYKIAKDALGGFSAYMYDNIVSQTVVEHLYNDDGSINKEFLKFPDLTSNSMSDPQYTQYVIDNTRKIIEDSFGSPQIEYFLPGTEGATSLQGLYMLANSQGVLEAVQKVIDKSAGGSILSGGAIGCSNYTANPEGVATLGMAAGGVGTGLNINILTGGANYNKDPNDNNDPPPPGSSEKKGFINWAIKQIDPRRANSYVIPDNIKELAKANITENGKTVLGHNPGYKGKAQDMEASYFDIGEDAWESLGDNSNRWAVDKYFLDIIAEKNDQIYLTDPINDIRPSWTTLEIQYLINEKGFRLINQYSLKKR